MSVWHSSTFKDESIQGGPYNIGIVDSSKSIILFDGPIGTKEKDESGVKFAVDIIFCEFEVIRGKFEIPE